MLVPLPQVPLDGLSWHYTGVDGLLGIISTHTLWASSPRVLNDTSELEYGAEVLAEAWANMKGGVPEPCVMFVESLIADELLTYAMDNAFILSTSLDGDLLSQWMHYSKSDGFAIAIDRAVPIEPVRGTQEKGSALLSGWATVIYEREEQVKVFTDLLGACAQTTPGNPTNWEEHKDQWPAMRGSWRFMLGSALLHMKHPAFVDEREVRYICGRSGSPPKFRASGGRLIPYVEIARDPHPHESRRTQPEGVPEPKTLPIKEIVCGPDVRRGTPLLVESMLSSFGYEGVEVRTSDIPYSAV